MGGRQHTLPPVCFFITVHPAICLPTKDIKHTKENFRTLAASCSESFALHDEAEAFFRLPDEAGFRPVFTPDSEVQTTENTEHTETEDEAISGAALFSTVSMGLNPRLPPCLPWFPISEFGFTSCVWCLSWAGVWRAVVGLGKRASRF